MKRTNYLSLEIRYCVESDTGTESFQTADEAEQCYQRAADENPPARQFVGLYARVPAEDREALPMGLLQSVGDFTKYGSATEMLDLLSGTTREERAARGDPDRYLPELHVTTNGQVTPDNELVEAACCIWEAMLEAGRWGQSGPLDPPENEALSRAFEAYGTSEMRMTAVNLASHCHEAWASLHDEDRYDSPFDWEFVPAYVALADWKDGNPVWPYPTPAAIGQAVLQRMKQKESAA